MKILFLHRNFPGQFKFLAEELAKDTNNQVIFITNNDTIKSYSGIKKITYKLKRLVPINCHNYLRFYEESVNHGQAAAQVMLKLKKEGFIPDVIYGHSWGASLFVKEVFPDVPYIAYLEWFYNAEGADVGFNGEPVTIDTKARLKCKNSHILQDLINCDIGISPTQWQKSQFPKEFQYKIKVIHEGVDTNICKPDNNAQLYIKDKNIILTKNDEVLTYATRGMEEYRGFPEFMKAASVLQKIRPNLHVVIGGEDRVCYGKHLINDTFKNKMLRELPFDMSRLHFVGNLPYDEYIKLLQVSTVHTYLTYPFVLSWSLLEAMSVGCCILASKTAPVEEVIKHNYNGILTDFYDIAKMVEEIIKIFTNYDAYTDIRNNARETIKKFYNKETLVKKQIEILNNITSGIGY